MPDWNKKTVFLVAGRIVLAVIFLYFGYLKVRPAYGLPWSIRSVKVSLLAFAINVDAYEMLPHAAALQTGKFLPPFEIIFGVWLLSGLGLRYSSLVAVMLFAGFLFAVSWVYFHGIIIQCGCGNNDVVGPRKITEDALMLALAVGVATGAWTNRKQRPDIQNL
jgi:uncharacterized membrane protein YphA (DoxX/SURF4 family)